MNISKLRHVVAVDRAGSFTAAAASLNITQSSVTKSVAEIERELGVALFHRRARGVVTTAEGREFIDRAARVLGDFDDLVDDARGRSRELEAVIRVGVCPPSIEGLLRSTIRELIHARPDLRLHVSGSSIERGIRLLQRGDIDAFVGPQMPVSWETDLQSVMIAPLHAYIFVRKGHPLAARAAVSFEELLDYPVVLPDRFSPFAAHISSLYEQLGRGSIRGAHVIQFFPTAADIVATSDAVGFIGSDFSARPSFDRRFVRLACHELDPIPMCCAFRARWLPTRSMRAFVDCLGRHLPANDEPEPEGTVSIAARIARREANDESSSVA